MHFHDVPNLRNVRNSIFVRSNYYYNDEQSNTSFLNETTKKLHKDTPNND